MGLGDVVRRGAYTVPSPALTALGVLNAAYPAPHPPKIREAILALESHIETTYEQEQPA